MANFQTCQGICEELRGQVSGRLDLSTAPALLSCPGAPLAVNHVPVPGGRRLARNKGEVGCCSCPTQAKGQADQVRVQGGRRRGTVSRCRFGNGSPWLQGRKQEEQNPRACNNPFQPCLGQQESEGDDGDSSVGNKMWGRRKMGSWHTALPPAANENAQPKLSLRHPSPRPPPNYPRQMLSRPQILQIKDSNNLSTTHSSNF